LFWTSKEILAILKDLKNNEAHQRIIWQSVKFDKGKKRKDYGFLQQKILNIKKGQT
jgi:hypothetical protein